MPDGYNFTERVRKVLVRARAEAVRLGHQYVGTQHILLGLIREGGGVATAVMENLGADLSAMAQSIESVDSKKTKPAQAGRGELPYTSRARKALEAAMDDARAMKHSYVGTEHLLLGLFRDSGGIAAQILAAAKLTVEAVRAETLTLLGTELPPDRRSTS